RPESRRPHRESGHGPGCPHDEETGEETRDELVRYFPIGAASFAAMPLKGRLYLGINENVFKDNDGELTVLVYHKKK
ncbi:MAG: hypothetical protein PHX45_12460, partial [Acidobacteriota bacterium]|nr:hypothetical protein [Acidobacteriota bacterium]